MEPDPAPDGGAWPAGKSVDPEYVHELEDTARALAEMWNDPVQVARHLADLLEEAKAQSG